MSENKSNDVQLGSTDEKLEKYHYNAYKNLVKIAFFLNAAGVTAVMASFALKYKDNTIAHECVKEFIHSSDSFDKALNASLDYFLISIILMTICVMVEYISYFLRREIEKNHKDKKSGFCNDLIKIFKFIMYVTLAVSFVFLLLGGFSFRNIPMP